MTTEKIIVKNFGPIREADLDLRKVTVFIGEQASGKSVLAKLITMFQDITLLQDRAQNDRRWWKAKLAYYNLDDFFKKDSQIEYESKDFTAKITANGGFAVKYHNKRLKYLVDNISIQEKKQDEIDANSRKAYEINDFSKAAELEVTKGIALSEIIKLRSELKISFFDSIYVPAERILLSFAPFINYDDFYLSDFILQFQEKRKLKKKFNIKTLDIEYNYDEDSDDFENKIKLKKNNVVLSLHKTASSIQSLVPLHVFIETINPLMKYSFVIEEPELNLYPTTQKKLVEYLIEKCTQGENRLIITTHSPYVLTALNNLIQAKNVVKNRPELTDDVTQIIPPQYHLDFEDVAAYFVADGTVHSIMNTDNQLIDANALDEVSNELSDEFGKLVQLEFQDLAI